MEKFKTDDNLLCAPLFQESPVRKTPKGMFKESMKVVRIEKKESDDTGDLSAWVVKGVTFPHGTKFRRRYKGYQYVAEVVNGALVLEGKSFLSPSAATVSITRNPIDGWLFWDCKFPGQSCWKSICGLKSTEK